MKIGGGISQAMLRKGSKLDTKKKRLDYRTTKCKTEYTEQGYSIGSLNPA